MYPIRDRASGVRGRGVSGHTSLGFEGLNDEMLGLLGYVPLFRGMTGPCFMGPQLRILRTLILFCPGCLSRASAFCRISYTR